MHQLVSTFIRPCATTPDPLSSFVISMSSRFFNWWIAFKSVRGYLAPLRWIQFSASDRRVEAAGTRISSGKCGSSFQYAFSKTIEDACLGMANFKPRQITSFWKRKARTKRCWWCVRRRPSLQIIVAKLFFGSMVLNHVVARIARQSYISALGVSKTWQN